MKTTIWKQTWIWSLTLVCSLWLNGSPAAASETTNAPTADDSAVAAQTNNAAPVQPATETNEVATNAPIVTKAPSTPPDHGSVSTGRRQRHASNQPIVAFGQHVVVKPGETVEAVVIFGGSAKVDGKVKDAVVVIGGTAEISGEVGDAAVAVGGSVQLKPGARVRGDAVTVFGCLEVLDEASVGGDAVTVFGRQVITDGAEVKGEIQNILPGPVPRFEPLQKWLEHCVLKLRPLSLQVGWVWYVAGAFLLLYLLVALVFPRPVQACVEELTQRPATTFLVGLLTKMLLPFVLLLLLVTGIGVFFIPFLWMALLLAGIVGKVAWLEYLGKQLGRAVGVTILQKPLVALLLGSVILTLLYLVPILALVVFSVTGMWALGAAVTATFSGLRRETPKPPAAPVPPAFGGYPTMPAAMAAQPAGLAAPLSPGSAAGVPPTIGSAAAALGQHVTQVAAPGTQASLPEAWQFPRAGFWERMGAGFLDIVVVGVVMAVLANFLPRRFFPMFMFGPLFESLPWLFALAYFAGMWAWRGTTVGGIVLNLKVVRLDGKPVTFAVALVRGLAGAFSVAVCFLGFIWVAWDKEKQGWHDKIAGTVVLRLPRGTPLVCV